MNWSMGVREVKSRKIKIGVSFILEKMNCYIGTKGLKLMGKESPGKWMSRKNYGQERV